MTDIERLLSEYENIEAALALTRSDLEQKRKSILAPVQEELDALEVEYEPMLEAVEARLSALSEQIKALVVERGETVRGENVMAVYTKARVMWDTDRLDGYAAAHPEIMAFRKPGRPSVSIRIMGRKG